MPSSDIWPIDVYWAVTLDFQECRKSDCSLCYQFAVPPTHTQGRCIKFKKHLDIGSCEEQSQHLDLIVPGCDEVLHEASVPVVQLKGPSKINLLSSMVLATLHFQSLNYTTHTPGVEQPHWDTSEEEDFGWRSAAPPMELTVLAENESTPVGSENARRARFFLWRRGPGITLWRRGRGVKMPRISIPTTD